MHAIKVYGIVKVHPVDLRSSVILPNLQWQFPTEVSGKLIEPIFKSKEIQVMHAIKVYDIVKVHPVDLRSSVILPNLQWQFPTEISGKLIEPIFKSQEIQVGFFKYLMRPIGYPETSVRK